MTSYRNAGRAYLLMSFLYLLAALFRPTLFYASMVIVFLGFWLLMFNNYHLDDKNETVVTKADPHN